MPSEYVYLSGKVKFINVVAPDQYKNWSVALWLDDRSKLKWAALKEKGIQNELTNDGEGYLARLRRPLEKEYRDGTRRALEPVKVFDKEGLQITGNNIGRNSDITCKIEVYPYTKPVKGQGKGVAIRLESLRVDSLVPFTNPKDEFVPAVAKAAEGLLDQPEPVF